MRMSVGVEVVGRWMVGFDGRGIRNYVMSWERLGYFVGYKKFISSSSDRNLNRQIQIFRKDTREKPSFNQPQNEEFY